MVTRMFAVTHHAVCSGPVDFRYLATGLRVCCELAASNHFPGLHTQKAYTHSSTSSSQCVHKKYAHAYIPHTPRLRIYIGEVPEWVYAFLVCKPVIYTTFCQTSCPLRTVHLHWAITINIQINFHRTQFLKLNSYNSLLELMSTTIKDKLDSSIQKAWCWYGAHFKISHTKDTALSTLGPESARASKTFSIVYKISEKWAIDLDITLLLEPLYA